VDIRTPNLSASSLRSTLCLHHGFLSDLMRTLTELYRDIPQFLQEISVYRKREKAAYAIAFLVVLPGIEKCISHHSQQMQ